MPKRLPPELPESRYTGKTIAPGGYGGDPCSDCCHREMYLPDGQPYQTALWLCAGCGKHAGFHYLAASCGRAPSAADAHPLRVPYHRPNQESE